MLLLTALWAPMATLIETAVIAYVAHAGGHAKSTSTLNLR
jgi:hypothetical protein